MAGPCSVENEEQIISVAQSVKAAGAQVLRGGAFKPRTSPYAFQGLHEEGIRLLLKAREATGLPIVTEIMDAQHLPLFEDIDIIQVGARNMQNFELLKQLGKLRKPVLLKRGMANTLQELLMSAEYVMAGGNEQVILCERGIRTFETATRNTMDLSVIPVLHQLSHLPVVVDPSHATGRYQLVPPMALAATAAGADGLIIEVHNDPGARPVRRAPEPAAGEIRGHDGQDRRHPPLRRPVLHHRRAGIGVRPWERQWGSWAWGSSAAVWPRPFTPTRTGQSWATTPTGRC